MSGATVPVLVFDDRFPRLIPSRPGLQDFLLKKKSFSPSERLNLSSLKPVVFLYREAEFVN
ncbi:MAG: hypothetical protein JWP63_5706 [Candidatus Solibacter sp.]|nr:hypothetical protein [Candidatus Solibacter sp.]